MVRPGKERAVDLPDLPPKQRLKPQRRGNIGPGKLYVDEAEFKFDLAAWEMERERRRVLAKERERARKQQHEPAKR